MFGGDDLTLVADGRIGLSLATVFLERFAARTAELPDQSGSATGCAGVAIAKTGRPFARVYGLGEELCQSAKAFRREHAIQGACVDWHFTSASAGGALSDLRNREYSARFNETSQCVIQRPVTLAPEPGHTGRSWHTIESAITIFQSEGWRDRRNKIKALRETLRQGPDAVHWFRDKFLNGAPLPSLEDGLDNWKTDGWHGGRCGYFDAIEIFDHFVSLKCKRPADEDMPDTQQ